MHKVSPQLKHLQLSPNLYDKKITIQKYECHSVKLRKFSVVFLVNVRLASVVWFDVSVGERS